jgi:hypothetical protein
MDDVDIALFERDWNNTLYYFMINADEQIYMRYGGRDASGPTAYLDLNSLELALTKGLELHRQYQEGKLEKTRRPAPLFPREIPPLVERTFARNQCVECHLVGDYQLIYRQQTGTLNKLTDMYRWPDIKTLGIELDVPKGLVVKEARGAAQASGMKARDRIASLNGTDIWTFGDFQYRYGKLPRVAKRMTLTVERDGSAIDLDVTLPERWWLTNLTFRNLSIDPRPEFESLPLTEAERRQYNLPPDGLASRIIRIGGFADMLKIHELKTGDIVYAVDGVESDEIANTPELFIKLRKMAGSTVTLDVIRNGVRMRMPVKTIQMYFRK